MRFSLIDRVTHIEKGTRITALKNVSYSEEYLRDHFPCFPVLPGVLMLEALTQAAAWLIRVSEDFAHSMVLLKEARNVKFGDFVAPGNTLSVTAELKRQDDRETTLIARGEVGNVQAVTARLVLHRFNLADANPADRSIDQSVIEDLRQLWSILCGINHPPSPAHEATTRLHAPVRASSKDMIET